MSERIAKRILAIERRTPDHLGTRRRAAFDVCDKLRKSLSSLAGEAGFRSLLTRALALAVAEVNWLETVTIEPDGSLSGLEVTSGLSEDEIDRGEIILLAQLVKLLVIFIGESLTLRLLQDAWPEVSRSDMNSGPESEQ